jgi:hypothetical protein
VSDQDLIRRRGCPAILAEYLEPSSRRNPAVTISVLVTLLRRRDVVAAVARLRARRALRVVK